MLLWGGQTVNVTGSQVSQISLPLVALSVLHASAFQVSFLSAMGFAPYVLVGLPAGALADRYRRRPLMLWCSMLQDERHGRWLSWGMLPVFAVLFGLVAAWLGVREALLLATGLFTLPFVVLIKGGLPGREWRRT
jgi:MFS family permease